MTNTIPKLKAASPSHERHRIYANMLTLDVIMETLWTHGLLKSDRSLDGDHISEGERWSRAIFQNKMIMGASPVSRPRDYPLPAQHPAIRKALNVIEPLKGLVLRLERKLQMAHDVYVSLRCAVPDPAVTIPAVTTSRLYTSTSVSSLTCTHGSRVLLSSKTTMRSSLVWPSCK